MISLSSLFGAVSALAAVRASNLNPKEWRAVAAIVARVQRAIHVGDEAELNDAVADLPSPKPPAGGLNPNRRRARGNLPNAIAGNQGNAPDDLLATINEAGAALEATTAQIVRIPHIDVGSELPVEAGQSFSVVVYLDKTPSRADESAEPFELRDLPAEIEEITVDVWLTTTPHFAIEGPATDVIVLRRDDDASSRASFTVTVVDPVPEDAGPPALRARFDYRLRASGSVRRDIPIMIDTNTVGDARPDPSTETGVPAADHLVLETRSSSPDLEISIASLGGSGGSYKVVIKTEHLGGVTVEDEWNLSKEAATYVTETMAGFVAKKATSQSRRLALEGAGIEFFDSSPKQFQELYWRLVDAGTAPSTILLASEERSVPWELMIPSRNLPNGEWQRLPPLGVQCAVGRWHGDDYVCSGQIIPLQDSLVLAPAYNPPLSKAIAERDLVLELFPGKDVPATFDELDEFYTANTASLLHFVCHGRDTTLQAIKLLKDQSLWANQVRAGGLGSACRKARPLVFLNACEVGRPGAGLAEVGGFAAAFIACNAGGVIAPLWAVDDGVAHQVAVTFYDTVKREPTTPFADILRELRAKAYAADGEDSYAAYCFYGDPHACAVQP